MPMNPLAGWNPLVPAARREAVPTWNPRPARIHRPTHLILHVTGTDDLEAVRSRFRRSVSAHYLVDQAGQLHQFVPDGARAWHAGIRRSQRRLYRVPDREWMRYLWDFSWYRHYPEGAPRFDAALRPATSGGRPRFVRQADGAFWPQYEYFRERWPGLERPVHFDVDPDPNAYSIGIECLSYGATAPGPPHYTPELYAGLRALIGDLCERYDIPRTREHVLGHEDVNPLARFGWDPNQGFAWDEVL